MSQEENGVMLTEFLEKSDSLVLVIYVNQQGQLTPMSDFPATSKNKVFCENARYVERLVRMRTSSTCKWVWLIVGLVALHMRCSSP